MTDEHGPFDNPHEAALFWYEYNGFNPWDGWPVGLNAPRLISRPIPIDLEGE